MTCVFWKEGASKRHWGLWSPEGCRTEQPSPSQVLCRCHHLSYFAVLMVRVLPPAEGGQTCSGPHAQDREAGQRLDIHLKGAWGGGGKRWVYVSEKAGLGFRYGLIQGLTITKTGLLCC